MKRYVYVVRDKKLGAFGAPSYSNEDAEHTAEGIKRGLLSGQINDSLTMRDQALYFLGYFDDMEGKFGLLEVPQKLLDYEDFIVVKDGQGSTKDAN